MRCTERMAVTPGYTSLQLTQTLTAKRSVRQRARYECIAAKLVIVVGCRSLAAAMSHWLVYHS